MKMRPQPLLSVFEEKGFIVDVRESPTRGHVERSRLNRSIRGVDRRMR